MSNKKIRSDIEIKKIILNAITAGESKPTRIQYKAMVSPLVMSRYITSLINRELIEEKSVINNSGLAKKRYAITEKGLEYLRLLNSMDTVISF
ncbi:MAG: winged helix-turn-helix domain-containing protein [Promethearchaeota archaeon]